MWHRLKRHPFPVVAHFRHCLVLAYMLPRDVLTPLLPPGLELDAYEDYGFVAIAMVQTRRLRPAFLPAAFGQDFFLTGYRIFTRYTTPEGRRLRGLRILRSDTDKPLMTFSGNLLTHYNYHRANVTLTETSEHIEVRIRTPHREADLHVVADLTSIPAPLPSGSPFRDLKEARRYAGPLPFTFDYEPETHSIIRIQGVRDEWNPYPVRVDVREVTFFDDARFANVTPVLANAFYVKDIPYRWERGIRSPLPETAEETHEAAGVGE
jgi:hypothetical protein